MTDTCVIVVRRGALHFSSQVYERYFHGLDNVVLLRDGTALFVMPVRHAGAGGYVIKLRNGKGDRAIVAADFFRDCGIEDDVELTLPASWSDQHAALIAYDALPC